MRATSRPLVLLRFHAAAVLLCAAAMLAPTPRAHAADGADREYQEAVRAFREGRTSDAFGRFIDLANRGDVDAARIALFMHSYGAPLYGKYWEAGAQDVAHWQSLVRNSGNSGRPVAEFQPTVYPDKPKTRVAVAKSAKPALKNVADSRTAQ